MANQAQRQVTLLSDASVGTILQGIRDPFSNQIKNARLQGLLNFQKESALAIQAIAKDSRLQQATEVSISNAFMNISFVGLSLNPIKQHCALLPRWNNKIKRYEASLSIMYRGLMWLAGQAGVKDISVDVVYSADRFKIIKSDEGDKFEHEIAHAVPRDDPHDPLSDVLVANKFQGAYVAARMPGSTIRKVEWIPAEHIYVVRGKSESYIDSDTGKPHPKSPWTWAFDEMAKKVVIKIAQKRWEEAVIENEEWKRFQAAVALDNVAEGVIHARASDIPGTAEHIQAGNDKPPAEDLKLNMKQLAEIEKLVEQVAPNTDQYPGNTSAYMAKMARSYRANALSEVSASKLQEIKDRIDEAIKVKKAKAAANPKADDKAKAGEGGKVGGKQQDGSAKAGAGKKEDAGKAPGSRGAGEGSGGGDQGSADREQGHPSREPGSDDDRGSDPEDSTRTPGPDNSR